MLKDSVIYSKNYHNLNKKKKFNNPEEEILKFCVSTLEQFGSNIDINKIYDSIIKELEKNNIDIHHIIM